MFHPRQCLTAALAAVAAAAGNSNLYAAPLQPGQQLLYDDMKLTRPSTALAAAIALPSSTSAASDDGLAPLSFTPLPLGSISASGWLLSELQTEAAGLAGAEYDFYSYVHSSSWLGGTEEYSDLHEGFPYWFNGLVPLAYGIDDQTLKDQVHSAASYVLDHQADDGWIGPETGTNRNFWARYPLCLGLIGLAEANATGWEEPIVGALHKFAGLMNTMLKDNYTGYHYHDGDQLDEGDFQWGQARVQDMMISLMWLYEKHPDDQAGLLMENLNYLYNGSINWSDWYVEGLYPTGDLYTLPDSFTAENYPYEHGVNVGQGLKAPAVYRRLTHNDTEITTAKNGVQWTFKYHGAASGTVLADERIDGLSPYTGSELCTAVETMYSLFYLYQALGDNYYADRAELTTFNAMPAMLTPDWWAHQYMEEPNQPYSVDLTQSPFYNTNSWGQTFGLEPNYPCCTVNHPQGLPKFLSNSYVLVGDNGLAHALLGPSSTSTKLGGTGGQTSVKCDTNYPFGNTLTYTVTTAGDMSFYVRVPAWAVASDSSIKVNDGSTQQLSPDPTSGLHELKLSEGTSTITYILGGSIVSSPRANDTVAVTYGPLLYALEIGSSNTSTLPKSYSNQTEFPEGYAPADSRDYQMTNTTAWNYAVDPTTLKYDAGDASGGLSSPIFAPGAPPQSMTVEACLIDWPLFKDSVPGAAPPLAGRKCLADKETVKLVPYGSQKLHMAELPTIDLSGS